MRALLFLLIPLLSFGQPEFFGYFESEADLLQVNGKDYGFGYNKLRVDMEVWPNDHVQIGANINVLKYFGKTEWDLNDFLPTDIQTGAPFLITMPDTLLLDNVYMKMSFDLLDLTLGRQQISTGFGYAWNPTDIFNSKSLLDPSYEQTGVSAIRLDLPLPLRSNLTSVMIPKDELAASTQHHTLSSGLGRFDLALSVAYEEDDDLWTPLLGRYDVVERSLVGLSTVGEIAGIGIWVESAWNTLKIVQAPWSSYFDPYSNQEESFSEYVIGLDYTLDNSLYLLTEIYHNGSAVADKEALQLDHYLNSISGETHSLMQDYGFIYLMHPTFDFVTLSAIVITNLNDQSGFFAPQLDWNAFEDTNISLQAQLGWGDKDSEFGLQDLGFRLRVLSNF